MARDPWAPIREARLAKEAATAEAEQRQVEQDRAAHVSVMAEAFSAIKSPGDPGAQGDPGEKGEKGDPGEPAPFVVRATFERGAYGAITGLTDYLSDGTTRRYVVERVNGRPTDVVLA